MKIYIQTNTQSDAVIFAKEQFKKYLPKIFGSKITVTEEEKSDFTILLKEDAKIRGVKHDGFNIENTKYKSVISAKNPRGVLNGVYEYLERYFGVRFLTPDCEIVPKKGKFVVAEEKFTYNPKFPLRGALTRAVLDDKEFASKTRTHYQFELTEEKYGGNCPWDRIDGNTGHNSLNYVKPEIYANTHPELFGYNGGRISDICFNNGINDDGTKSKDALSCVTIICDYIKKRLQEDKAVKYFMIGQQDSWGGNEHECVCPRCKATKEKYGSSGTLIRFLNVVADEIKEYVKETDKKREVYIVGFSYSQTFLAPVKKVSGKYIPIDETVVPRDNVIMWLCQSENVNRNYNVLDRKHNPIAYDNFYAWNTICKKIMLWDYDVNFSEYFWYYPSLNNIEDIIKKLSKTNCEYGFIQLGYADKNEWQSLYKGYVASRLLWNPSLNAEEVLNEYLVGYYGEAAPYVKSFMKLFDEHFAQVIKTHKEFCLQMTKSDDILFNANYYSKELFNKAEELLDKAELAVREEGKNVKQLLQRINVVRLTPMRMKHYNFYVYNKDKRAIFTYYKKMRSIAQKAEITKISEEFSWEQLDWQMKMVKELIDHELAAWDVYRYIYDGIVGNYQLPNRKEGKE